MYKIYSFHWIRIHLCINGGRIYFIIIMICVPLPSHILDMSVMNIEHRIGTLHRYHHPLTYCHLAELQQRWSRTEILLRRSCRWVQCKCIHRFFGYKHTQKFLMPSGSVSAFWIFAVYTKIHQMCIIQFEGNFALWPFIIYGLSRSPAPE